MGRAERRKKEREQKQSDKIATIQAARQLQRDIAKNGICDATLAMRDRFYMAQVVAERRKQRQAMEQNGITVDDLNKAYERGYAAARSDLVDFMQLSFYASAGIALHSLFGFGEKRIVRTLNKMQYVMTEEITSSDLVQRLKSETGVDVIEEEYVGGGLKTDV